MVLMILRLLTQIRRLTPATVAGAALVVVTGCGPVDDQGASVDASGEPVVSVPEAGVGEAGASPTVESAAEFAVAVVGRLEQEAFYAADPSFVEPFVWPESYDEVVGSLDARVDAVRWAIATFPGSTERTWFVSAPLSVEVTGVDPEAGTATVEVWAVTVFAREDLGPPETRFVTAEAELRWDGDRWLIAGLGTRPGPSASLALDEASSTPEQLTAELEGHQLIGFGATR